MGEKLIERGNMADVSLTTASLKAGGGGVLIFAWIESHMNFIIGILTILYFLCQLVVILPKTASEVKRHWSNFVALFERRKMP